MRQRVRRTASRLSGCIRRAKPTCQDGLRQSAKRKIGNTRGKSSESRRARAVRPVQPIVCLKSEAPVADVPPCKTSRVASSAWRTKAQKQDRRAALAVQRRERARRLLRLARRPGPAATSGNLVWAALGFAGRTDVKRRDPDSPRAKPSVPVTRPCRRREVRASDHRTRTGRCRPSSWV